MPLLSDDQAARLRDLVSSRAWSGDAGRWIKALIADRDERIALLQHVSRQLEAIRRGVARGNRDLQALLTMQRESRTRHGRTRFLVKDAERPRFV